MCMNLLDFKHSRSALKQCRDAPRLRSWGVACGYALTSRTTPRPEWLDSGSSPGMTDLGVGVLFCVLCSAFCSRSNRAFPQDQGFLRVLGDLCVSEKIALMVPVLYPDYSLYQRFEKQKKGSLMAPLSTRSLLPGQEISWVAFFLMARLALRTPPARRATKTVAAQKINAKTESIVMNSSILAPPPGFWPHII